MPVRANLERPDYIGAVGQSLGGIANVADQLSPMDPRFQRAIMEVIAGGDPKQVAAALRGGMQAPEMPSTQPAAGGRQMRMPADQAAGDVQHPFPTTNLRAPRLPSRPSFSEDMTVTAPSAPAAEKPAPELPLAPFARRDAPMLMQLAQMTNKHNDPLAMLKYELNRDRLAETVMNRLGMQPGRDARTEAARALTANLPFNNKMKQGNLDARLADIDVKRGNLDTRRKQAFLRGAGEELETSIGLGNLVDQAMADPAIVGTVDDFTMRRAAEVADNIPMLGKFVASLANAAANEKLTPRQQQFKAQVVAETSAFLHSKYGSALTGYELALANKILGGNLSVGSTVAGLIALRRIADRKIQLWKAAFPDAYDDITSGTPGSTRPPSGPPAERSVLDMPAAETSQAREDWTPGGLDNAVWNQVDDFLKTMTPPSGPNNFDGPSDSWGDAPMPPAGPRVIRRGGR